MKTKRISPKNSRFRIYLPAFYVIAVLLILALRNTGLNACRPAGLITACIGNMDILYLFAVLPGLFIWISVNQITSFLIPFVRFDYISAALGLDSFTALFLVAWAITVGVVFLIGNFLDNRT